MSRGDISVHCFWSKVSRGRQEEAEASLSRMYGPTHDSKAEVTIMMITSMMMIRRWKSKNVFNIEYYHLPCTRLLAVMLMLIMDLPTDDDLEATTSISQTRSLIQNFLNFFPRPPSSKRTWWPSRRQGGGSRTMWVQISHHNSFSKSSNIPSTVQDSDSVRKSVSVTEFVGK